jgi:kynurenine formamidase
LLGSSRHTNDGKYVEPGIPINLKITISIIDPSGERILSEQEVSAVGIQGLSVNHFDREIEQHKFRMSPGLYRVTVENLKGIPEFADIKVVFVIYTLRNV